MSETSPPAPVQVLRPRGRYGELGYRAHRRTEPHEKLTGLLRPHPRLPPRRRRLGVVRPGAAERGGLGKRRGWISGGRLAEFAMSRQQERGREGLGLQWSRIPEGGAITPTQRPSSSPAALSHPGLPPSSSQRGQPRPRVPLQHSPQPLST